MQGYLFGRPVGAEQIDEFVSSGPILTLTTRASGESAHKNKG
jgi:hypothetical protein